MKKILFGKKDEYCAIKKYEITSYKCEGKIFKNEHMRTFDEVMKKLLQIFKYGKKYDLKITILSKNLKLLGKMIA